MAEFKKLSEVDLLETSSDNATVLIEEDGDIKRVPKKEVGGAGGYVIKLVNSYINDDGLFQFNESYDELYDILVAGGSVWVDYTDAPGAIAPTSAMNYSLNPTNFGAQHSTVAAWYITDIGLMIADFMSFVNDGPPIIYPNGSHNLEPNEGK